MRDKAATSRSKDKAAKAEAKADAAKDAPAQPETKPA